MSWSRTKTNSAGALPILHNTAGVMAEANRHKPVIAVVVPILEKLPTLTAVSYVLHGYNCYMVAMVAP